MARAHRRFMLSLALVLGVLSLPSRASAGIGIGAGVAAQPPGWMIPRFVAAPVLWLRADKGTTIATGVSAWADQSGTSGGCTFSQATGSKQPALSATGGPNSRATVNFTAASSQTLRAGASNCGLTNNDGTHQTNLTCFAVGKSNSTTVAYEWFGGGDSGGASGWNVGTDITTAADHTRGIAHAGVGGNTELGSATTSFEAWTIKLNTSTFSANVNGTAQTMNQPTNVPLKFSTGPNFDLGSTRDVANYLNGSLSELTCYNSALSANQITTYEAYERAWSAIW